MVGTTRPRSYSTPAKRARSLQSQRNKSTSFSLYKPVRTNAGNQPFAQQRRCTVRYAALKRFTAAAGGTAYHVFSTNGLYDPDITGVGTQPLYFDQLMTIYNHYTVIASRARVTFGPGNTNQETQICGVHLDDDANPGTVTGVDMAMRPGAIVRLFNPDANAPVIKHSWNAKRTFAGNPLSKSELSGDVSNNPTEQSYYIIWVYNTATATTQDVELMIQIEYDVVFHELKTVAFS